MIKRFPLIVLGSSLLLLGTACTEPPPPSGLYTTDGSYLTGPTSKEEAQVVANELATQRAYKPSNYGMRAVDNPGGSNYKGSDFDVHNYVRGGYWGRPGYWRHHRYYWW